MSGCDNSGGTGVPEIHTEQAQPDFTARRHRMLRRLAMNGLFIAMAMVLSVVERWIPVTALIPIPGVKLGLANIITLFILFYAAWTDAVVVTVLRCLLTALLFGGMSALLFSLAGSLLAIPAMLLIKAGHPRWFSVIGISMAGAVGHNLGQLGMAVLTLKSTAVLGYLPILLGAAMLMGTLTALVADPFFTAMERTGLVKRSQQTDTASGR